MLALRGRKVAKTFAQNAKILSPSFGRLFSHFSLPTSIRRFSIESSSVKCANISFLNTVELLKPNTNASGAVGQVSSELPILREVSKHESLSGRWIGNKLDGPGLLMYYDSTGALVNTVQVVGRKNGIHLFRRSTPASSSSASTTKTNHIKAHQYEFLTEGKSYAALLQEAVFEGEQQDGVYKQGTLRYNAHLSATGEFKNNQLYNGTGCLISPQGMLRIGTVVDGRMEGYGVLYFASGDAVQGVFTHSRFVDTHCIRTSRWGDETLVTYVGGACRKTDGEMPFEVVLDGNTATISYEDGRSYSGDPSKYFYVSGTGALMLRHGGIYRGAMVSGARHGLGWQRQIDGSEWEGEFRHNRAYTGAGTFFLAKYNLHYEGSFVAGKLHGPGRVTHSNGDVQEGEFSHGRLVIGKLTVLDGTVMVGQWDWTNGICLLARGRKHFPDGNMHEGVFGAGGNLREGTVTKTNGVVESGKFKNGLLVDGTRAHPGGPTLEGRFVESYLTQGKVTNSAGDVYEGAFVRDKLTRGKLTIKADGRTMEGEWTHKDGLSWLQRGMKRFADGTTHEGTFDAEGRISEGAITWTNGVVEKGKFASERLVEGKVEYPSGATCEGRFDGETLVEGKIVLATGDVQEGTFDKDTRQLLTGTCTTPVGHVLKMVDGLALRRAFASKDEISAEVAVDRDVVVASIPPTEELRASRAVAPTLDIITSHVIAPEPVPTAKADVAVSILTPTSILSSSSVDAFPASSPSFSTPQPGTVKYADGSVYEGSLLGNEKEGLGTLTYADGRVHYGMFKNDVLFDGEGVVLRADGSTFEGNVQGGKWHGWGKSTSADGTVFEGRFDKGLRAFGKLTFADSGRIFEGEFRDDLFVQGRLTQDDAVWEGTFRKNWPLTGSGVLVSHDRVRSGMFVRGELEGEGSVVYTKGGSKIGHFVKGKLIRGTRRIEREDGTVVVKKVVRGIYMEDEAETVEPVTQPHTTQLLVEQLVRAPSATSPSLAFAASSMSAPLRPPRAHSVHPANASVEPAEFAGSADLRPAVHIGQYRVKFIGGVQSKSARAFMFLPCYTH